MTMTYQVPRGTRDFLPEEMKKRRRVFETARQVLESYGYGEVNTPAFESFELLAAKAGPDIENEIYAFEDKSKRKLGLRFDLTVPNARIVASNPAMAKPAKFYTIDRMWRYDKPQAGRYREFWQASYEIFGSSEPEADAEVIAVVNSVLQQVSITEYYFRINSRKIIDRLAKIAGIPESKTGDAFRAIDKLDKLGEKEARGEMERYKIPEKAISKFISMTRLKEKDLLLEISKDPDAMKDYEELKQVVEFAEKMNVKNIKIDLSIVRGIGYYTGFVFETFVKGKEGLGSIASGGRYDNLVEQFGGKPTAATGCGIGLDRLMDLVPDTDYDKSGYAKVFVAAVKDEVRGSAIEIASMLRKENIATDIDLMKRNLKKQFDYCNSKNIQYCVIVGPQELVEKQVTVRDMQTGSEEKVQIMGLARYLQK